MIVRQFLHWIRTAPAAQRAEATAALARAYLYSDLSPDDRAAAEGAMIMSLDDASPLVRHALADGLADSPNAPPAVIHALASDQPDIAAIVLEHSVLFIDADLVELVATGEPAKQAAIARRAALPRAVAAAIAEVGTAEACLTMIESHDADVAQFSIDRIAERFGTLAAIRESLLTREDLPASTRHALVSKLSVALADFVTMRQWLERGRADRVVKEACEKATITIAADVPGEARALVRHLRVTGQLTVGLILRGMLSGNIALFEESLSELSDVPVARVHGIVHDRSASSFRALYDKAQLPVSAYPAFREAVGVLRQADAVGALGGASRLKRRMVERVLDACEQSEIGEIEPLLMLLRRFATEAAREEARLYCDELVAEDEAAEQAFAEVESEYADPAPEYEATVFAGGDGYDIAADSHANFNAYGEFGPPPEIHPELRYAYSADGQIDLSYGYLGAQPEYHFQETKGAQIDPLYDYALEPAVEPYYEFMPHDYGRIHIDPAQDRVAA